MMLCFLAQVFQVFWVKVIEMEDFTLQFNFTSNIVYMYNLLTEGIRVTEKNSISLFRFRITSGRLRPDQRCAIKAKDNKSPFIQETKMTSI